MQAPFHHVIEPKPMEPSRTHRHVSDNAFPAEPRPASTALSTLPSPLGRLLATGSMASLLSMAVLAWHGRRRHGSSTSLINSPSHLVHGDRALRANAFSLRFTLMGAAIHHLSSMFWAVVYEGFLNAWRKRRGTSGEGPEGAIAPSSAPSTPEALAMATVLSSIAWLVDTRLVPARMTPGFERRSSKTGMLMIYSAFAVGLTAGALMIRRQAGKAQGPGAR
jgi:hypothetical protein